MFDKKQFDAALTYLGDLTDEQKAVLVDARENGYPEQVLFEKLGVKPDAFEAFMKAIAKREQLFRQTVSEEELTAADGGIDALSVIEPSISSAMACITAAFMTIGFRTALPPSKKTAGAARMTHAMRM